MTPPRSSCRSAAFTTLALSLSLCTLPWMAGCKRDAAHQGGCLSGAPGCQLPTPCPQLSFSCPSGDTLVAKSIAAPEVAGLPGGTNTLGSTGDVLLSNGKATAVIARLNKQNFLDPNGGSLLDLSSRTGGSSDNNDGINDVYQVAGILPRDAVRYETMQIFDGELSTRAAVQFSGRLDDKNVHGRVTTLYEMRPCEPGIRVRTELINEGDETWLWFLSDTWYWSKREPLPFAPYEGGGLNHPSFGLLTINDAFRSFPYMSSSMHSAPYASYSEVACNQPSMEGINSETVSAVGPGRIIVPPREYVVFERFIAVTPADDAAGATDVALEVRKQLFGEANVAVSGKVSRVGALRLDNEREVSLLISEGTMTTPPEQRTPYTQVVPDAAGNYSARVPAGKTYVLTALSFGVKAAELDLGKLDTDTTAPDITLPSTARLNLTVTAGGPVSSAYVMFVPADAATKQATAGDFHGTFGTCSPWLGPPPGSSPACDRVLTDDNGAVTVEVPVGNYDLYAFKGPFYTLERVTMNLAATTYNVQFNLLPLPLALGGALSADLHVHGAASFDSQIPDLDRVRSFDASGLDVIVATDHDVVNDYTATVRALNLDNRISTIDGVETTGHIPWLRVPNYGFPLVIGHYNFWPLQFDRTQPRNGGPFDDLIEPGKLFDNVGPLYTSPVHMAQLNHPWAEPEFGRDLGFPRAIKLNATQNLPATDDQTNNGVYVRVPAGASTRNDGHISQEVMNGTSNAQFLEYRAFWWYTLNQGQRKVGTANSDSHGLTDNLVGFPRNLVYANTNPGNGFDVDVFDQAIADGRVLGTNGPVIVASVDLQGGGGASYGTALVRANEAGVLHVTVAAAPWVPVDEIRVVVNGKVVKTISGAQITKPADPFGALGLLRFNGTVPLSELLTGVSGDAWIVVEAGSPIPLTGDLGGGVNDTPDGIPDTTDNNNDGKVDKADVSPPDAVAGPIVGPALPADRNDPAYHYSAITFGVPEAFTNPFFLDRNGNGTFDAPTVTGGR